MIVNSIDCNRPSPHFGKFIAIGEGGKIINNLMKDGYIEYHLKNQIMQPLQELKTDVLYNGKNVFCVINGKKYAVMPEVKLDKKETVFQLFRTENGKVVKSDYRIPDKGRRFDKINRMLDIIVPHRDRELFEKLFNAKTIALNEERMPKLLKRQEALKIMRQKEQAALKHRRFMQRISKLFQ